MNLARTVVGLIIALQNVHAEVSFLDGRFVAVSDHAAERAAISKDVKDMFGAKTADVAKEIYTKGKNSVRIDGKIRSVRDLTVSWETRMASDPEYIRYWHALAKTKAAPDEFATADYADAFIQHYLDRDLKMAASSTVTLGLWMFIIHELRESYSSCMDGDLVGNQGIAEKVEFAAAYYFGADQKTAASDGFSLYSLAQTGGEDFDTLNNQDEAIVNEKILELFKKAQFMMRDPQSESGSCLKIREIVDSIVDQMTVPLLQKLIMHLYEQDHHKIREYALAVVPLLEGCSPADFRTLSDVLIVNYDKYNFTTDFDHVLDTLEFNYPCFGITCEEVGSYRGFYGPCDKAKASTPIVGYKPDTDVRHRARIDLDILQIRMFVESEAYDLAEELYYYGRNSRKSDGYHTLFSLATSTARQVVPSFQQFRQYFLDDDYAHSLFMEALEARGKFMDASTEQLNEIAVTTLQYMVLPMAIMQRLYESIESCKFGDDGVGDVLGIDQAWAYIVGSIEGDEKGGYPGGQGLYALAKKTCTFFDTCNNKGGALNNDRLLTHFVDAQSHMSTLECVALENDVARINQLLLVPLIQGALRYARINGAYAQGEQSGDLGAAYVFSRSHLPLMREADSDAFETLEVNFDFNLEQHPIPDDAHHVFEAYEAVVKGMGLDCEQIGVDNVFGGVCDSDETVPNEIDLDDDDGDDNASDNQNNSQGSDQDKLILGNGLFVTSTNVLDRALVAKDQEDIMRALRSGDYSSAKKIYEKGKNSKIVNEEGEETNEYRTLQSMSKDSYSEMKEEPMYALFNYGLRDKWGNFDSVVSHKYADTFVQSVMLDKWTLAGEAIVALNIWMYVVHKLEKTLRDCHAVQYAMDADDAITDLNDGVMAIDEAAAYYIGTGQETGIADGPLLYALAERRAEEFGEKEQGQARVNTAVVHLLNQAKTLVSFADACIDGTDTYERLRFIVERIKAQMTVPLVQSLIKYMKENDKDRVRLYAISVVPLVAGCSPSAHKYLKEQLIDSAYDAAEFDKILAVLRSSYTCLKIKCGEVGGYKTLVPACENPKPMRPIAGYVPATDVREHAKLDLDVHQINIFMTMHATEAAMDTYLYGRNSVAGMKFRSLQELATKSTRSIVPEYQWFKNYFTDADYADTLLMDIFRNREWSRFYTASPQQKTEAVTKALTYQVMYMYVMRQLYDSVDDCYSGDPLRNAGSTMAWDEVAAFFVGSMEGEDDGGSLAKEGTFLYGQFRSWCRGFGTCNELGSDSILNEKILSILIAGQQDVIKGKCASLLENAERIEKLVISGVIQSTLWYAMANEDLHVGSTDRSLAAGDVVYGTIAPLVKAANFDSDKLISRNMEFQLNHSPVSEGSNVIFTAVAKAIPKMGVDCEVVGVSPNGQTVCWKGADPQKTSSRSAASIMAVSSLLLTTAILAAGTLLLL